MKRLAFTTQALQDFQNIHDYIARDNADAALDFIGRLEEHCRSLCHMPGTGPKRDELSPGLRSSAVGDYLIFYRIHPEYLEIIHVVHGKRDLPKLFQQD